MTRRVGLPLLVSLLALAATLAPGSPAVATTAGSSAVGTARPSSATALGPAEFGTRLLGWMNLRRARHGCHQFRPDAALALAAARHNDAMWEQNQLSHRLAGEADLGARISAAGYLRWRRLAENLAWGQTSPRAVFRAWVQSPGHRANLDDCRLRDVGIAVAFQGGRPWVTTDFGRHHR
jgi:uncharacterized protein YkwD